MSCASTSALSASASITSGTVVPATIERAVATAPSASVSPGPRTTASYSREQLHEFGGCRRRERLRLALRQPDDRRRQQVRLRNRDDGLRHREGDVARTRSHRASSGENRRTRVGPGACDHEHAPAGALVRVGRGQRQQRGVLIGGPELRRRRDVGKARIDTDLGDDDLTRVARGRVDHESALRSGEGYGAVRRDRRARNRDRYRHRFRSAHRPRARTAPLAFAASTHPASGAPKRSRRSDSEQRVDDARCRGELIRRRRCRPERSTRLRPRSPREQPPQQARAASRGRATRARARLGRSRAACRPPPSRPRRCCPGPPRRRSRPRAPAPRSRAATAAPAERMRVASETPCFATASSSTARASEAVSTRYIVLPRRRQRAGASSDRPSSLL